MAHITLKAEDLVGVRVLLECLGLGRAHDLNIGAVAHEGRDLVVRDASGIGTELSHSPGHAGSVVHLGLVQEGGHRREAEGADAAGFNAAVLSAAIAPYVVR